MCVKTEFHDPLNRPVYADNRRLSWVATDPGTRRALRKAVALQEHYQRLAEEAGNIKMGAAADAYRDTLDYDEAARRIGRDPQWVRHVVGLLTKRGEVGRS